MEPKYVFAIAAGSLFLLLFIIYLFSFSSRRKKKAELKRRLDLAYAPKNLKKMDLRPCF